MKKRQIRLIKVISFLILLFLFVSSFSLLNSKSNTILIATKNLTEQRVVAYMLEEVIERDTNYEVDVVVGLDATSFLHNAIIHDDIDIYIEYSSTALIEIFKQKYTGQSSQEVIDYISKNYEDKYDLQWITSLGFDNSNTIICNNFCKENNIKTFSDLAQYDFSFAAPPYFYDRSDGYNLLEDTYNFGDNVEKRKMDLLAITVAVNSNKIDTGLAFTTDAKIATGEFTILEDDLNSFPVYDAGVVVRNDILEEFPELKKELLLFEDLLNNEQIQWANNAVEEGLKVHQDCKGQDCEVKNVSAKEVAHILVEKLNI